MAKGGGEEINCSFCGRKRQDVGILIAGVTGHICDNCVEQAKDIIKSNPVAAGEGSDIECRDHEDAR